MYDDGYQDSVTLDDLLEDGRYDEAAEALAAFMAEYPDEVSANSVLALCPAKLEPTHACRAMLLAVSALCMAFTSAAAQQPTEAACHGGALRLEKVVTLGDSGDGYVGLPISVVRWQNGWAVTHNAKPENVSLFDSEGGFVRDIGRAGEGPGEFRLASLLVPKRDTLHVYDHLLGRVSRFGVDGQYLGSTRLGYSGAISLDLLEGGHLFANVDLRTRMLAGLPVHVISTTGELLRSFGADKPIVSADLPHINQRHVSTAGGRVWIFHRTAYIAEEWSAEGVRLRTVQRVSDWFEPHGWAGVRSLAVPPSPYVLAAWLRGGCWWSVVAVADPKWRNAVTATSGAQGRDSFQIVDEHAVYDTVVEVIDVKTGSVVSQARLEASASTASGRGYVVTARVRSDGEPVIDVWLPILER